MTWLQTRQLDPVSYSTNCDFSSHPATKVPHHSSGHDDPRPFLSALPLSFKGDVVQPGDSGYVQAIKRWSKLSERNARLVLYPKDEEDVVAAVKFGVANHVELVVKGESDQPPFRLARRS